MTTTIVGPFTHCEQCATMAPDTVGAYAIRADGARICYRCATDNERATMATAHDDGAPYTVYGPSELTRGASVHTWPGAHLARVVSVGRRPHPWTTRGRSYMGERYWCTVVDPAGRRWRGWLGAGLASTIRPVVALLLVAAVALGAMVATAPDASATTAPDASATVAEGLPASGGAPSGPPRIRARFGDRYAVPHTGPLCWQFMPRPRAVVIVTRAGTREYRGAPCRGPVTFRVVAPRSTVEDEVSVAVFGGRVHVAIAPRPRATGGAPTMGEPTV